MRLRSLVIRVLLTYVLAISNFTQPTAPIYFPDPGVTVSQPPAPAQLPDPGVTVSQPPAPAQLPDPRIIVTVLDLTPSFHNVVESEDKIKEVVRALGPGDSFILLTLGGNFSPGKDVAVECIMPKMDPDLLTPAHSIREWQARQARIAAVWASTSQKQAAILASLNHPFAQVDGTPLYQLLTYVSHWFASAAGPGSRSLIIFSDMQHNYSGRRSSFPPKPKLPFEGVTVTTAFVPWGPAWGEREKAWRNWFSPSGFTMLDEANARVIQLVSPNTVPRHAAKGF